MRKIDAFEEYGVRGTYHVPKKAFRGVENLHGACMNKDEEEE